VNLTEPLQISLGLRRPVHSSSPSPLSRTHREATRRPLQPTHPSTPHRDTRRITGRLHPPQSLQQVCQEGGGASTGDGTTSAGSFPPRPRPPSQRTLFLPLPTLLLVLPSVAALPALALAMEWREESQGQPFPLSSTRGVNGSPLPRLRLRRTGQKGEERGEHPPLGNKSNCSSSSLSSSSSRRPQAPREENEKPLRRDRILRVLLHLQPRCRNRRPRPPYFRISQSSQKPHRNRHSSRVKRKRVSLFIRPVRVYTGSFCSLFGGGLSRPHASSDTDSLIA